MLDYLDDAATIFDDDPCFATADRYIHIAIDYCCAAMITSTELKNIFRLVQPYLGAEYSIPVIME